MEWIIFLQLSVISFILGGIYEEIKKFNNKK